MTDFTKGMTHEQKAEHYESCDWGVHGELVLDTNTKNYVCKRCLRSF